MKVIVPIDNKPSSQATIDNLVGMCWYEGTDIKLVTVLPAGTPHTNADGSPTKQVEEIENIAVELRNSLRHCEVSFLVRDGDPQHEIVNLANSFDADLILMGSNCKGSLERLMLGSVSQGVLNESHCPVLIARPPCTTVHDTQTGFKNVLIPIDDSAYSEVALRWMANFRWRADANFLLTGLMDENSQFESVNNGLAARAKQLSSLLQTDKVTTDILTGEAADAIIGAAKQRNIDLIVIGSHGRTGIKKLLLGSVSQAVSQHAPCSIVVVHGILAEDDSWSRTGVFQKPKVSERVRREDRRNDDGFNIHVMPGGM